MPSPTRLVATLLLPTALAGCQLFHSYPYRSEIGEEHTADLDGVQLLRVDSTNGHLVVLGENRDDLQARITKFARGSSELDARRAAEDVKIELVRENAGRTLTLIAHVPRHLRRRSAGASMEISIPRHFDLDANTSNGRIEAREIEGDLRAKTSNGKISASQIIGDVDFRTSNGSIHLDDVDSASIVAATSNGSIRARQCRGDVRAETSNGPIDFQLISLPQHPRVFLKTSNGSVSLDVPATTAAALHLRTSNGSVDADLAGADVSGRSKSRHSFEATLNGGGGRIEARTSNGKVRLRTSG